MKSILILEDEYFQADDLAKVTDAAGFRVIGPFGDIAAVSEADIMQTDGAVLDINLNGEMVYSLLDRLHAKGTPVALLTGYDPHLIPLRFASFPMFIKPDDCAKAVACVAAQIEPSSVHLPVGSVDRRLA